MGITDEWGNLEKIMDSFQGRHATGVRFGFGSGEGTYGNAMFLTLDLKKLSDLIGRISPYKAAPPYLANFLDATKQYIMTEIPKKAFESGGLQKAKWADLSPRTVHHRAWLQKIGYNKHGSSEPLLRNSDSLFSTMTESGSDKHSDEYLTKGGKNIRAFIEIKDTLVENEPRRGVMRYEKISSRFIRHMFDTRGKIQPARPMIPRNNTELDSEDYAKIRKIFTHIVKVDLAASTSTKILGNLKR